MLKFIQYQIDDDTEAQQALEKQVSAGIAKNINSNIAAFREHIPSLVDIIDSHQIQQYSLFCTKEQQLNIVDFSTGRAFYGVNPQQDVSEELAQYFKAASYFSLTDAAGQTWRRRPLPSSVDVMLVFGMGLGYHLTELISNCRIRFLVVYEPNLDMLMCSVQTHDWSMLLDTARALGTHIFIQAGSDASGITSELAELLQFDANLHDIYVYRHQFHPVMDEVINYLMEHSGDLDKLTKAKPLFAGYQHALDYVPEHAPNTAATYQEKKFSDSQAEKKFAANMEALQRFYPEIYQSMLEYQPANWFLVEDHNGQANVFHRRRQAFLYSDLEVESREISDYFISHPFKDDVVISQKGGGKLWRYLHFDIIENLKPVMETVLEKQTRLPSEVDSLLVFGVALGKHLDKLLEETVVNNLYICEPNIDLFYASLYIIDWSKYFFAADKLQGRIYLNLGGDGSNYFYDLMAQFYQVGAYSIADTYILASYYNSGMQKSISDLRSELKVVLALGEYYDHSKYGIAHTYHNLKNNNKIIKNDLSLVASDYFFDKPVVIVGNGPSLDEGFAYINEIRDKVILISCGTSLRALYKKGITPDFHAEIEQNRSTYDWISQINDKNYLNKIILLSVNGIHPDTSELFRDTVICFKEGEASTYVFQNGLQSRGIYPASLSYAYPTVTNLVMNFCIKWGFKYFYLFGVDLGFIDVSKHHSIHSSYYSQSGSQVYDYFGQHGGGIASRGNFRPLVFTKPEFDVSRKLLEQAISHAGRKIEVYNCSDGVLINGAMPLRPENIIIEDVNVRASSLQKIMQSSCYSNLEELADDIYEVYSMENLAATMEQWQDILRDNIKNQKEAKSMIRMQWELLRKKAVLDDDLTFCLYHGSANYIAGILTKLAANIDDKSDKKETIIAAFNRVLELWRYYLAEGFRRYSKAPLGLDDITVKDLFEKDNK